MLTSQARLVGKEHRRDRYRLLGRNVTFEGAQRRINEDGLIVWPSW